MIQKKIQIINKLGLHARAAMKLTHLAARYASDITIKYNHRTVNAKSIMGLMVLAAACGHYVELTVVGEDEKDASRAIEALIDNRFDETE